eukprot:542958-Rhodomonas_salina.4
MLISGSSALEEAADASLDDGVRAEVDRDDLGTTTSHRIALQTVGSQPYHIHDASHERSFATNTLANHREPALDHWARAHSGSGLTSQNAAESTQRPSSAHVSR